MTTIFETGRLRLRHFRPDDVDALYEVFADPYARRFYPQMVDRDRVAGWIDWNLRNYRDFGFGLWAAEPIGEARLIGDCGLTYQPVEGVRKLEIGYHLHAAERGQGLATEAARAVLGYARDTLDVNFVCSIVHPDNTASRALAGRVHDHVREFRESGERRMLFFTNLDHDAPDGDGSGPTC